MGQRWIVVTGLVPYKQQLTEYHSKFAGAAQEGDDVPRYAGFLVQRGEVLPGAKANRTGRKSLPFIRRLWSDNKFSNWTGTGPEVADPRFIDGQLASHLPPLADGVWGEEVVCPPQIKLLDRNAKAGSRPTRRRHGTRPACTDP